MSDAEVSVMDDEASFVMVAENADAASGQLAPSLAAFNLSPSVFVGGVPMLVTKGFGSSRSSARIRYTLPRLAWK